MATKRSDGARKPARRPARRKAQPTEVARAWVVPVGLEPGSTPAAKVEPGSSGALEPGSIPLDFVPTTEDEMAACLRDPMWRICSGQLYKIMVKTAGGDDGESFVLPFVPNRAQRRLIARLWHRNIILKARQLGFTTLICILWLDHALFNEHQRCVIVAQDKDKAVEIFRDKVKFAYESLPEALRAARPVKTNKADELLFSNNSSIRVSTSARGGTPHRLHISEYGKICAKYPDKAEEIITGTLPAVPLQGIVVIESTAEGQEGDFYDKTKRAIASAQQGKVLTPRDYRIHFFPWWQEPGYVLDGDVLITEADQLYFLEVEAATGTVLLPEQRRWYVATRESDFGGDPERMWQEYPSTAKEAFQVSTEGCYYAVQLATARKQGRITRVPWTPGVGVNTFWDIGSTDGTAIWLHQRVGFENRWIGFIEGWCEPYEHFIQELQKLKYTWDTHYLPHDAGHKRQQGTKVCSPYDELSAMAIGGSWIVVDAVDDVLHGIQKTREQFATYYFDEQACAKGLVHLGNYRKTWNRAKGAWNSNVPRKVDGHSEAADAIRQHAQGYIAPGLIRSPEEGVNWRVA